MTQRGEKQVVWTEEDAARAAGMKRAGMTNAAIAERLGRSPKAVQGKCHKQGARRRLCR